MKGLVESIFSQENITKDPFDIVIDRMDPEKYTYEITVESLDQLFKIGGKRYGFYSMDGKRKAFSKAIQKDNWIMLARKNYDTIDDYAFEWMDPRHNGYIIRYQIIWKEYWVCDDIDLRWDIRKPYGAEELIDRNANMSYEECILITDKKKIDAIKKRLEELAK